MKKIILINIIFLNLVFSQQTPAPSQDKSVLIYGGITHVGNGELINNSVIGFTNGKIDLIASTDGNWSDEILNTFSDSNNSSYDTIINASNHHIYPGIIALNTNLGLVEVDAVRASVDDDESGTYLPEIRSIIAYNAESKAVESIDLMVYYLHRLRPMVALFLVVLLLFSLMHGIGKTLLSNMIREFTLTGQAPTLLVDGG